MLDGRYFNGQAVGEVTRYNAMIRFTKDDAQPGRFLSGLPDQRQTNVGILGDRYLCVLRKFRESWLAATLLEFL